MTSRISGGCIWSLRRVRVRTRGHAAPLQNISSCVCVCVFFGRGGRIKTSTCHHIDRDINLAGKIVFECIGDHAHVNGSSLVVFLFVCLVKSF